MHLNKLSRTRRHRAALRYTSPKSNLLRLNALIGVGLLIAAGSLVFQPPVAAATGSATRHVAQGPGARASLTRNAGGTSRGLFFEQKPFVTQPTVTSVSPSL